MTGILTSVDYSLARVVHLMYVFCFAMYVILSCFSCMMSMHFIEYTLKLEKSEPICAGQTQAVL